jgi:hypothetical protein
MGMTTDEARIRTLVRRALDADRVPPSPGFEQRVLLRATSEEAIAPVRPTRLTILLAAAAALLLVSGLVAVAAGVYIVRLSIPGPPAPVPAAPPPAPKAPAGSVYFEPSGQGPAQGGRGLVRLDWSGAVKAHIQLPGKPQSKGGIPQSTSPDGSLVAATDDTGSKVQILDAAGAVVIADVRSFGTWSDDSRHGCALNGTGIQVSSIANGTLTQRTVAFNGGPTPASGVVMACSIVQDRAIIGGLSRNGVIYGPPFRLAVVQLSTGSVQYQQAFTGPPLYSVASQDTRYLAVWDPANPSTTVIRDVVRNTVVGQVHGYVRAFSGDDRLVAVLDQPAATARIEDWRTGRATWTHTADDVTAVPEPGGQAFFVQLATPGTPGAVILVHSDGSSADVVQGGQLLGGSWNSNVFGAG